MTLVLPRLICFACVLGIATTLPVLNKKHETATWRIQMPSEDVEVADLYRCVAQKLPAEVASITTVQAFPSDRKAIHHAMIFVCEGLAASVMPGKAFECFDDLSTYCTGSKKQIWGYDNMQATDDSAIAPFVFPPEVGVVVGQNTDYRYALLQVHNNKPIAQEDTAMALTVSLGVKEPQRVEITQLCPDDFTIPPHRKSYTVAVEAMRYMGKVPVHLWGTHTHFHMIGKSANFTGSRRGKVVLRYHFERGRNHSSTTSYPKPFKVEPGDVFRGSCTYDSSTRSVPTNAGMTHDTEEMCNIGLMFFMKCSTSEECRMISSSLPGATKQDQAHPAPVFAADARGKLDEPMGSRVNTNVS
jgi:hypothetical protein